MSLETDVKILARVPMLSDFSEDKLRLLAFSSESRTFRDGQQLFAAGEPADAGIVVAAGSVALTLPGRPDADAETVGPGGLIGELALIVGGERGMTATAIGEVSVIVIRQPLFRRMLEEYPDVAERVRARVAGQLATATGALLRVRDRLDRIDE